MEIPRRLQLRRFGSNSLPPRPHIRRRIRPWGSQSYERTHFPRWSVETVDRAVCMISGILIFPGMLLGLDVFLSSRSSLPDSAPIPGTFIS